MHQIKMIFTAPRIMKTDYLKVIFFKRLSKYTDNHALINNTFDDLLNDYTGEKRHYHDLSHIFNLLTLFEDNKFRVTDEDVVFLQFGFTMPFTTRGKPIMKKKVRNLPTKFCAKPPYHLSVLSA